MSYTMRQTCLILSNVGNTRLQDGVTVTKVWVIKVKWCHSYRSEKRMFCSNAVSGFFQHFFCLEKEKNSHLDHDLVITSLFRHTCFINCSRTSESKLLNFDFRNYKLAKTGSGHSKSTTRGVCSFTALSVYNRGFQLISHRKKMYAKKEAFKTSPGYFRKKDYGWKKKEASPWWWHEHQR